MYCSALRSKPLLVAKVDEVISDTKAKVQIYEKKLADNKFMYSLLPENIFVTINRTLVHKVESSSPREKIQKKGCKSIIIL